MGAQVLLVGYESLNTSVPHWHAYLALQPAKLMKQVHLNLSLEKNKFNQPISQKLELIDLLIL